MPLLKLTDMSMFDTLVKMPPPPIAKKTPFANWNALTKPSDTKNRIACPSATSSGGFHPPLAEELGLPEDANPYYYYDLDWIVTVPNMDPWIRPFETRKEDTGGSRGANGIRSDHAQTLRTPDAGNGGWETDTFEKLEAVEFDDPFDQRRFFEAGDNQIAGVGDGFQRNSPRWIETVKSLWPDFPVFGSIIEVGECLTRLIGQQNALALDGRGAGAGWARSSIASGHTTLSVRKATIDAGRGPQSAPLPAWIRGLRTLKVVCPDAIDDRAHPVRLRAHPKQRVLLSNQTGEAFADFDHAAVDREIQAKAI